MPQQSRMPRTPRCTVRTTASGEILEDFPEGLDALITGPLGTGGHITGLRAGV
jgi:cysteine synthase A